VRPTPARSHAEAIVRFRALRLREDGRISVPGRSRFFTHGERVPLVVVLLHGFTTSPEQWVRFAAELFERGANVVVPRFPGHGYLDRRTHAIASVSADALLACAGGAVDLARGAGERVVVAGLSLGASMATAVALERDDIACTVAIVPLFGLKHLGRRANAAVTRFLETVPNAFLPWDPTGGAGQIPAYGYPRFPTKMLAESLRIGESVQQCADDGRVPAGDVKLLLNANEPACNNVLSSPLAARFNTLRGGACSVMVLADLPANHDIIDPTNANARIDIVYPCLHDLIRAPGERSSTNLRAVAKRRS